jgi:hypothetical protein
MPYNTYFALYWEPWYHYGTWLCVTKACAGLGDLNRSIKSPCVDYFDSHNQYRDTAKKTCGDMAWKFDGRVKEFAARMKVEAEVHVDTMWPVAQTLAVSDYVKNQSQPKAFFQLNCETQLTKKFPLAEPSEYTCEAIKASPSFQSALFKHLFEQLYAKCLADVDKQWPAPTAWSAACAPAADKFEILFKQEREYLGERISELVLGGCLIPGGNTGTEAIHLECTNYPVYQACLAILSHGAEQQHCALNQVAADQKVVGALMAQLGTLRCQVSGSDIVCKRPWKIDTCKTLRSQLLGTSAPFSHVQCEGDSTALAAFMVEAKQAEDILLVLNAGSNQERESPGAQGGRLNLPPSGRGRLCKLTWDPLAIDCRSKAPPQAHPEITLPGCAPDPNQDGADSPCLVPRLYKSDSDSLPGQVFEGQLVAPGGAAPNQGIREEGRVEPSAAASNTAVRETSRMAPGSKVFEPPLSDGKRVDICLNWGSGCGQAAADAFCQKEGFVNAAEFTVAEDIGAQSPTLVVGDGKLCAESYCDGFAMIRCTN